MNVLNSPSSESGGSGPVGPVDCAWVRDRLALRDAGVMAGDDEARLEAHLATCEECRTQAEFVARLQEARPEPPALLVQSVLARHAQRQRRRRPAWSFGSLTLSAAAVAAAALGIGVLWHGAPSSSSVWDLALDPDSPSWYGEEWLVAGGPMLEALSDDDLRTLLAEMEP
jgi:hypothetical protein